MFKSTTAAVLLVGAFTCFGQTSKISIVDLLTPDEFRRAGLTKLTPQEIQSLASALVRLFITLDYAAVMAICLLIYSMRYADVTSRPEKEILSIITVWAEKSR